MNQPTISVIVPVYNVKDYLRECLDSILAQTYCNLDIILVDDGSTDGSGIICDEYAAKDSRIRVFHTENQGISAARNIALDNMTGDWVAFVDSDDRTHPIMLEKLINASLSNNTSLASCSWFYYYKNGITIPHGNSKSVVLYSSYDIAKAYFSETVISNAVWERIYHKDFFNNFRFPEGVNYEDTYMTTRIISEGWSLSVIPDRLYYYRQRKGSTVHSDSVKNRIDIWLSVKDQYDAVCKILPNIEYYCLRKCISAAGYVWQMIPLASTQELERYNHIIEEISRFSEGIFRSKKRKKLILKDKIIVRITRKNSYYAYYFMHIIKRFKYSLIPVNKGVINSEMLFS